MTAFFETVPGDWDDATTFHGLIGPHAITCAAQALQDSQGSILTKEIFTIAGLSRHLADPPTRMVEEREAARLHHCLNNILGMAHAAIVSRRAGTLTADYLLEHRIPKRAQRILRLLPRRIAANLLVRAIARHAWTFVGSGAFSYHLGPSLELTMSGAPICRLIRSDVPTCHYYAATFERVFAAMLGEQTRVAELRCQAQGVSTCVFDVRW